MFAGAAAIVDHDRPAQALVRPLPEFAADDVGAAARGEWHDEPDRKGLRRASGRRKYHRRAAKKLVMNSAVAFAPSETEDLAEPEDSLPHRTPVRLGTARAKFAVDSLLEGDGFELSVPGARGYRFES